jgi:hypothetical protein
MTCKEEQNWYQIFKMNDWHNLHVVTGERGQEKRDIDWKKEGEERREKEEKREREKKGQRETREVRRAEKEEEGRGVNEGEERKRDADWRVKG